MMTIENALTAVTLAAADADLVFISRDEDGEEIELLEVANAAQAVESLLDPQGGWVRIDNSAWGRRQANPRIGYVVANGLEAALGVAQAAGATVAQLEKAVAAGRDMVAA